MEKDLYDVVELLKWFDYHNKNLTKTQYYKIQEAIEILIKNMK